MNDQCIYKSIQVMETYKKKNLNDKLWHLKMLWKTLMHLVLSFV